jgi:4-hydroxy-tetrahydrodipicolinate synthase
MEAPFGEVLTAIITPFTPTGDVDYGQLWRLSKHLVANGSDGIVVAGTTGESPTLSHDEKVAVFKAVVEAVGGGAKVVAGTGTNDTRTSLQLTRNAAEVGCDGVMAVTPYYSKPPQQGLVRHFTAIAEATDLPVLLYNIPGRSARLIEIPTLAELAGHPNIAAVKDAVDDVVFTARSIEAFGDAMAVYAGSDHLTLPIVAAGGVGVVSVAAHLVGPQIKAMVRAARSGDLAMATRIHQELVPLFDALFVEPNPMPVKAALDALWETVGEPRLPLVPAQRETVELIRAALGRVQQT